jgi:hypothetical protein
MGFDASGTGADVDPNASMEDVFASNRATINATGNVIGNEGANQLAYYDPLQQQEQNAQNASLNQLQQTPGFTAQEAGQINVDYSQFNTPQSAINQQFLTPDEQSQMMGNAQQPVDTMNQGVQAQGQIESQGTSAEGAMLNAYGSNLGANVAANASDVGGAASQGTAAQGAMLNQYQSELGAQLGAYGTAMGTTAAQYGQGVSSAAGGLSTGLEAAQGEFSGLDTAVNNSNLGFNPDGTEKQITDQQVQAMQTAAGVSAGNQFRTAEDTLEQQAAQAGNTSPAALAAMRQQLVTQEAATAGDVESQAQIQALQAQQQQATSIEQQRLGAAQTQAGMQATAATTEEAAAQSAAGLAGTQGISAQEAIGAQNVNAANLAGQANIQGVTNYGQFSTTAENQMTAQQLAAQENIGQTNVGAAQNYGQFSTGEANTMTAAQLAAQQTATNQQYTAASTAEQLDAQRAATLATNRQATQTAANQMQYQQGVGSQQATSQGAQTTAAARIAGEGAYRSGVAQQQTLAQQGGQQAVQEQLGAYGTQTTGATSTASSQAGFEVGKASGGDTALKALTGLFDAGGVADHPMVAKLAEHGPEMVIPLNGRYRSGRQMEESDEERFGRAA